MLDFIHLCKVRHGMINTVYPSVYFFLSGTLPPPELLTADLEVELAQLKKLLMILKRRERMKGE